MLKSIYPLQLFQRELHLHPLRLLAMCVLFAFAFMPGEMGEAARGAFVDAYSAVAVFVYATLLLFYGIEARFDTNIIAKIAKHKRGQVVAAAILGMMPGCGGAILVVTGFAAGQLSFGALVATLTATMGDAAFLLIAESPKAALVVLPLSMVLGVITGIIADIFVKDNFNHAPRADTIKPPIIGKLRVRDILVFVFFLPGIVMGVLGLAQVELPPIADQFALLGMMLTIAVWAFSPIGRVTSMADHPLTRANEETAFVMIWVVVAFLLFEISQVVFGLDLKALFSGLAIWTPLMATLIGLLPGCGPQILVTTFYLAGAIPFGALMANAISNDGDALFPAIAISPRAAILATLITTIPALMAGYGFFFLAPLFLST